MAYSKMTVPTMPPLVNGVVIMTKEDFDKHRTECFLAGVERGKFEQFEQLYPEDTDS